VVRVLKGDTLAGTGVFDAKALAGIADEHLSGQRDRSAMIWALLMFDRFLAKETGVSDVAETSKATDRQPALHA
jgi:hypothetical protein